MEDKFKNISLQKEPIMEGELTGYPSIDKPWMKYYDDKVINAKIPEKTIYEYLLDNNKKYLNRVALNYFGRKISYLELIENIDITAKALINYGVKAGDIVTICMPTLPETIYLFYALSKIGAIANMVDPRTSAKGIEDYVREVNSDVMFIVDVALGKIENINKTTNVKKIITISPSDSLPIPINIGYKAKQFIDSVKNKESDYSKKIKTINWNTFLTSGKSIVTKREYYPKYDKYRPLVIVHTGGTTGKPKGVVLTNYNINSACFQCKIAGFDFKREHNWLNIMPPFIAYGIGNGLHLPLTCGMEVVLIPQFDPTKFDELLLKYKPNHMVGVPSHYGNIIKSSKLANKDLSFIIAPTVGGDKMDENLEIETNEFLKEHNCSYKITKGYGMTEVNAAVAACINNDTNDIGSVGIPFPQTTISIFEPDTSKELKYNEIGEVCITGPNTMLGYYKNQYETDKILKRHEDGKIWVHSGDLGYMTGDGKLFIIDRVKRMIIRHDGFKIFPNIIEDVIMKHHDIKECKVVSIRDLDHSQGSLPMAYVVLKESSSKDFKQIENELFELCKEQLPEYSQPYGFAVKGELPLTPIGKVDFLALENESEEMVKKISYQKKIVR